MRVAGPIPGVPVQIYSSAGVLMGSHQQQRLAGVYTSAALPAGNYYVAHARSAAAQNFIDEVWDRPVPCVPCTVTTGDPHHGGGDRDDDEQEFRALARRVDQRDGDGRRRRWCAYRRHGGPRLQLRRRSS